MSRVLVVIRCHKHRATALALFWVEEIRRVGWRAFWRERPGVIYALLMLTVALLWGWLVGI